MLKQKKNYKNEKKSTKESIWHFPKGLRYLYIYISIYMYICARYLNSLDRDGSVYTCVRAFTVVDLSIIGIARGFFDFKILCKYIYTEIQPWMYFLFSFLSYILLPSPSFHHYLWLRYAQCARARMWFTFTRQRVYLDCENKAKRKLTCALMPPSIVTLTQ